MEQPQDNTENLGMGVNLLRAVSVFNNSVVANQMQILAWASAAPQFEPELRSWIMASGAVSIKFKNMTEVIEKY